MIKPELLCPAGDFERMKTAIGYGADAVYLGATRFGMRASPQNFTMEELQAAVSYAHERGVKLYLTVNSLPRSDEIEDLPSFIREAGACGVDAFIVADIGVVELIRDILPEAEIHASTQTGVVNHLTVKSLYKMGMKRMVLARELSLEEIKVIREKSPPEAELEAFVHGSMCMSVSGRCVISNYITDRDANRGACTQPCRWKYHLVEEKRPGMYIPLFEDESGSTILSAKDLCMIEHLKELSEAGIISFKIEGRAKSDYYVGVVTNAYRAAVDAMAAALPFPAWTLEELSKVSHREYSTGFFFGNSYIQQSYNDKGYIQDWEITAVAEKCEDGLLYAVQRNRFSVGDELELLNPGVKPAAVKVTKIYDEDGNETEVSRHPMKRIAIPFSGEAQNGAIIRRKKD